MAGAARLTRSRRTMLRWVGGGNAAGGTASICQHFDRYGRLSENAAARAAAALQWLRTSPSTSTEVTHDFESEAGFKTGTSGCSHRAGLGIIPHTSWHGSIG